MRWVCPRVATLVIAALISCRGAPAPTEASLDRPQVARGAGGTRQYVMVLAGRVPELAARIAAVGGTVTSSMAEAGLAVVRSDDAAFAVNARSIPGIGGVAEDRVVAWAPPGAWVPGGNHAVRSADTDGAVGIGEPLFAAQWAVRAVHAPEAWAAGFRGLGVRIAVVDGGIYDAHVDIAPNLDVAHSRSFALDENGAPTTFNQDVGTFWHGTHVAGIAAAPAQGVGTVGIAPEATIIGVKALHDGRGSFGAIISAIYYAATPTVKGGAGADIINLSLGAAPFRPRGADDRLLLVALSKVTTYAYQQGVTLLAAAGNDALDFDHSASVVVVPAQSAHVIPVAATGPIGWADRGDTGSDPDRPASYSNVGRSVIALAAPGGDFTLFPTGLWYEDMVLAPCRGDDVAGQAAYCWAAGTSMATPAAAGVAALIIGRYGRIGPAQVEARLRASADDLGKPGTDAAYGAGRINALRAIQ